MKLTTITLVVICLLFQKNTFSQTAGSGTLNTIENLARKESENSRKIGELNKKHADSYVSEDIKSKRLNDELAELERKKTQNTEDVNKAYQAKLDEIQNSSTWKNRRKSAQSGWKEYNPGSCSAGGPPPICVVQHWYKVSVSEAMSEYDALVKRELDKIRNNSNKYDLQIENKKKEISDFLDGDNEFSQLRNNLSQEINKLFNDNLDIRKRIAELSKVYVDLIEKEIASIQNFNIRNVMGDIAQKHFVLIRRGILEAKIKELEEDERKSLEELNNKLRKQNNENILKVEKEILQKQELLRQKQTKYNLDINTYNAELNKLNKEKRDNENTLKKKEKLKPEEIDKINSRNNEIENLINIVVKKIEDTNLDFKEFKSKSDDEITKLRNDIWSLTTGLTKIIQESETNLKKAYNIKREVFDNAIAGTDIKITNLKKSISSKRDEFNVKVKSYENLVEPERIRLMKACSQSGSSCWGSDVTGKIFAHAEKLIRCSVEKENNYVTYSGCEEAFAYYSTVYNSYMNGISDEDLGKLKKYNYKVEYQKIINNIK